MSSSESDETDEEELDRDLPSQNNLDIIKNLHLKSKEYRLAAITEQDIEEAAKTAYSRENLGELDGCGM